MFRKSSSIGLLALVAGAAVAGDFTYQSGRGQHSTTYNYANLPGAVTL